MQTYVFGTKVPESDVPVFGALVKTEITHRATTVYGLIYNIEMNTDDSGMTKLLSVSDHARPEDIEYARSKLIPLNVSVLCVGYAEKGKLRYGLPPQPPVALREIEACGEAEIAEFTLRPDYLKLVMECRDAPCDELLAASIRLCAGAWPETKRDDFLLAHGRELARLMGFDSARLENVLRRIA
jgi:hypothetical protein